MKYNGWANYETWAVFNWITNSGKECDIPDDANKAADAIRAKIEEGAPEIPGVYADLLGHAIKEIDFKEIANALLEEE